MNDPDLIPPSPSEADYAAEPRPVTPPLDPASDPFDLFAEWLSDAVAAEPNDPHAMTLATAGEDGSPDARIVLLKALDDRGFSFFTNLTSAKARDLAENPRAALVFHWKSLRRQVRIRGDIESVSDEEADAYFATRSRISRLGSWASDQSKTLPEPAQLERRLIEVEQRYEGAEPPRPPHWSGYRVIPQSLEFWRDGAFRLHERLVFERAGSGPWRARRLYP
jgi:pyridoxamine 5'-phosphate oxidase